MTTQDSSIYSDPAVRAAIRETIAESATSSGSASDWIDDMAAEKAAIREENRDAAAVEAVADKRSIELAVGEAVAKADAEARERDEREQNEAIGALLIHITARAAVLIQERLLGDSGITITALREIASLTDEALSAAGIVAPPAAWTLETAPLGARALSTWDGSSPEGEWSSLGDGRYALISPMLLAAKGIVRSAEVLAAQGGRLTLLPVNAAPAPQPVAETPADDSPAGQLLHAARVAAGLIERLGDRIYRPNVRHNDINVITGGGRYDDPWAGDLRYLANLRECVSILGATVTARITATGGLTVAATCVIDGVDVRIAAPLDPGSPAEPVARAWLAELGVEVQS